MPVPSVLKVLSIISVCSILVPACQRKNDSTLSAKYSDSLSVIEEEGGFKEIYAKVFGGSPARNADEQVELWPHTQEAYPAFASMNFDIYKQITEQTKEILNKDHVLSKIREMARSYNLFVYLSGASASRVAYLATLGVRRKNGDRRISPYRVGHHFDEMFPFRESLMEFVVDGGTPQMQKLFSEELEKLISPIHHVAVESAAEFDARKSRLNNSCSRALIPLETSLWYGQQLGTLPFVFNQGVLNETDSGKKEYTLEDVTDILGCLSLFDLSPTKDLTDSLRNFISKIDKAGPISIRAQRYTYAMLWEMRHIYRFRPLLKSLGWTSEKVVNAYKSLEKSDFREAILSMIDKEPMNLGFGGLVGQPNPMKFGDITQKIEESLKFNHSCGKEANYALRRNPYGLPNAYISRKNPGKALGKEIAVYGDGLYSLPGWKDSYGGLAVYLMSTPRAPFWGQNCKKIEIGGSEKVTYALSNHASYFYVVDPRPTYKEVTVTSDLWFAKEYAMQDRCKHIPWKTFFIQEQLFNGNFQDAEKIASLWAASDGDPLFDKRSYTSYFKCEVISKDDVACRLRPEYAKYFKPGAQKPPQVLRPVRPVLKPKIGTHPVPLKAAGI